LYPRAVRDERYVALVVGAIAELSDVELAGVEAAVGSSSFKRGRGYAHGRVVAIKWDPDADTLVGSVVGQGALYDTAAFFAAAPDGALAFDDGECTCPVGHNCKHVAAIVIAAIDGRGASRAALARRPVREISTAAQPPSWEKPLRALIDAPAPQTAGNPLAIELALHADGFPARSAPRLTARLMRSGARGGWVNGSLTWSRLDSWHVQSGDHRTDHLALIRELYAIHRAREGRVAYHYHYGGEKTLDLGGCDSPQLWSLLDEASRLGLKLVHAHPGLGEVRCHLQGELLIDVTRQGDQGSLATAVLRVNGDVGDGLEPLLFLGASGHGVVCAERADVSAGHGLESRRLALVRLAKPAAPQLQRMVLAGERLEIPLSELDRFADELCPALRNVATVTSSDGSFVPPEVSPPTLALRASYGADHVVEAEWGWEYQVGATTRRAALGSGGAGPGFRDLAAERAILADAVLAGTDLERFGLLDGAGRPADAPAVALTGLDSMRFTTEGLPRLAQLPGVTVEIEGRPADYRDVGDSLTIGVSTADIAGERDWFDLGVTISVDGRELPLAEVFVALASGDSHVLLADGAHFSLLAPRLQALRQADRGGTGADGVAVGAAADQPLPGRAVGRVRRTRRRDRAGAGVAAAGRCVARARCARRARSAADAGGAAAPLPARRVRLAGVAV